MDAIAHEVRGQLRWVMLAALTLPLAGCAGHDTDRDQTAAVSNGVGGGSGGASVSEPVSGGGGTGGAGELAACSGGTPPPLAGAPASATGHLDIPVAVTMNDAPMTIGTPATAHDGRQYKLSLLKLFLADPALVDAAGHEAKAQLVGADGKPLPYGLQLVDADDSATEMLRLAAPIGTYTALHFGVGVPAACNTVSVTTAVFPLNPDSDMFWTWGSQFLCVRIEGTTLMPPETAWIPFFHHVGYDPAYGDVRVPANIVVNATGTGPTLSLDVDRMLATDATTPPGGRANVPDGWVIDNLETNHAFTLR